MVPRVRHASHGAIKKGGRHATAVDCSGELCLRRHERCRSGASLVRDVRPGESDRARRRGAGVQVHHCSQLPSHGVPLFDRSMACVPQPRHHAHPCNANVVTGAGRKPRPSRMRCLPMAPFSLPWRRTEIPAHPVFTAALGRSSRPTSSYIRSAARLKRSSWLVGMPHIGPRNPYWSSDRTRRLAYTGFLLSRTVMS